MHREETMKPTNTGRLIADVLPASTFAFLWQRIEPDASLLQFLAQRAGSLYLVFPENYLLPDSQCESANNPKLANDERDTTVASRRSVVDASEIPAFPTPTFILLDGTWKQARKMFHMSRWLEQIPLVRFDIDFDASYQLRQGAHPGQVSTLEAAAGLLKATGDIATADLMHDYFALFNEHYAASRGSRAPQFLAAEERILQRQTQLHDH